MDVLIETWIIDCANGSPETAAQVRERVTEIIDMADQDVLDLARPRALEQDVLDILDEPAAR